MVIKKVYTVKFKVHYRGPVASCACIFQHHFYEAMSSKVSTVVKSVHSPKVQIKKQAMW